MLDFNHVPLRKVCFCVWLIYLRYTVVTLWQVIAYSLRWIDRVVEVLGFDIGDSESKAAWMDFFSELKQRSLTNVDMFVSDAHCGLRDAITTQSG